MASQYRTYPQAPPQRMAHPPAGRRGPAQFNQSHTTPAQQHLMRQQNQAEIAQATQRAKKPTDRNMPEGIEDIVYDSGPAEYKKMRDFERRLDAVMMRKMLELQDKKANTSERKRKLRIWISNTADGQPWQSSTLDAEAFDFNTGADARYRVKIVGKLLDDDEQEGETKEKEADAMDEDIEGKSSKTDPAPQKMSHFFKSISVDFDRSKSFQADQSSVEWKKPSTSQLPNPPAAADFDTLEFERKSDENLQCTINFYRDETPERFQVSKPLAQIIDAEVATRDGILAGIWEYAKAMELQQDEEKRMIQCDEALRSIFNKDVFFFPDLPQLIVSHISPLPPIALPYTIRVDADYADSPTHTIYDILVPAPLSPHAKKSPLLPHSEYTATLRQLAGIDDSLAALMQNISDGKARHSFFQEMSKQPVEFVQKWFGSQQRDLELILGDSKYGSGQEWVGDEWRRGGEAGVWGTQNVRESVGLMVSGKGR